MNDNATETCTVEREPVRLPKRDDTAAAGTGGDLLDQEATARRLGVSPRMVRRLWQRRELRAVKVGKLVRFAPAEIDRFIRDNQASGAA